MPTRPATEDTTGTCDWGRCDGDTVAERLDPQSGQWLAVCDRHKGSERRRSPGRAACPVCGKTYVLNVGGTARLHTRGSWERCPGSGQLPTNSPQEAA